jgi:hypothetical protein
VGDGGLGGGRRRKRKGGWRVPGAVGAVDSPDMLLMECGWVKVVKVVVVVVK